MAGWVHEGQPRQPGDLEPTVGGRRSGKMRLPGSPFGPNGLPIGRIGNPCSMDPPKGQPLCLVDWTSRFFFFCWKNFCPLGTVCGLLLGGPMSGVVGSSTSILRTKSYGE